jgi:glycogen synthase
MYYRPHYSGLTIYTERLAKALAARGHQVTVLTSRFSRSSREQVDGVTIIPTECIFGAKGLLCLRALVGLATGVKRM